MLALDLDDGAAPGWAGARQFRLTRLQVVNWGTFDGSHVVDVSPDGFLVTGESGSGKSSLLDAITVMLVPAARDHSLNAAARDGAGGGKDRDLLTYVRGAWSTQSDAVTGEAAVQFLRPGTTWSAIVMTFTSGTGAVFTMGQVLFVKGKASATGDVQRRYFTLDGPFDARDLAEHVRTGLDNRVLKTAFPEAAFTDGMSTYIERFRRRLGIERDLALRLLHKTQSAKGLSDLNALLRDFMLDEPETFRLAEVAVAQFTDLKAAHDAVQDARRQIDCLAPVRELDRAARAAGEALTALAVLSETLPDFEDVIRHRANRQRGAALAEERARLARGLDEAAEESERADRESRGADDALRERGGDRVEYLKVERDRAAALMKERAGRLARLEAPLQVLGLAAPKSLDEFEEVIAAATAGATAAGGEKEHLQEQLSGLSAEQSANRARAESIRVELTSLRSQRSNLDPDSLRIRQAIADGIGRPADSLPFAGELLQVRAQFTPWQGAIERLLRGFAKSILVPDEMYPAVAAWVDRENLRGRLVYYRIPRAGGDRRREVHPDSVAMRVDVADGRFRDWLAVELSHRFDHVCVDDVRQFGDHERAMTAAGQVKHSQTRHEKDDRSGVGERRNWLLGFDNEVKQQLVVQDAQAVQAEGERIRTGLDGVLAALQRADAHAEARAVIVQIAWRDIDVAGAAAELGAARQLLADLEEGDVELADLRKRSERARDRARAAAERVGSVKNDIEKNEREATAIDARLTAFIEPVIDAGTLAELDSRVGPRVTLNEVAARLNAVALGISKEEAAARNGQAEARLQMEKAFVAFNQNWPVESADVAPGIESAAEYLRVLDELEADRLPEFEDRFMALLQQQSSQGFVNLRKQLEAERQDITERIEPINETLAQVPFYPGSHLQLRTSHLHTQEVTQFNRELTEVISNSAVLDRAASFAKFDLLERLVSRLRASTSVDRAWRDLVLDVRRHVEFRAIEQDADGREVAVHNSGRGQSGGQRQKLVTFCLAAALRYQLGGRNADLPSYATVVLDEAFDKADSKFTRVAMTVFQEFGFQMVIATPLKLIEVLDDFVGGTALVQIKDRKHSFVTPFAIQTLRDGAPE
jgi:uncharacterized protein YPO0396